MCTRARSVRAPPAAEAVRERTPVLASTFSQSASGAQLTLKLPEPVAAGGGDAVRPGWSTREAP